MNGQARIQACFYNDPDCYPPIINSSRLLARYGFVLDILCRDNEERWEVSYPSTVRVHRIDTRTQNSWLEYFGFVVRVLGRGRDGTSLFVGHDGHGLLPARLLATRYRRPLVYHCHDFRLMEDRLKSGGRIVRAFERRFARTADLVIVPDAERGAVIAGELCLQQAPLVVANAPITGPVASGEALHSALVIRERQFDRILFRQGRIGVGHAIESTLRSIPYWANQNWGFVLMGFGEPSYLEKLSAEARALGIERQFAVLPPVGYDQVAQFTPGAHAGHALYEPIHVNHVYSTTASNKMMEHMAAGLPLLVSDTPSMRALVHKHNCGLTADESSPESIAAAVNTLLGDPDRARCMGAAARQAFAQEFCYERQFAPMLDAFRRLSTRQYRRILRR